MAASEYDKRQQFLQGILTAMTTVATITGERPIAEVTPGEWKMICSIQSQLAKLAADEAARLEQL